MSDLPPVPTVALPSWMARSLIQPCGCVNGIDRETGIQRAWRKCHFHKSQGGKMGIAHHEVMGSIVDGIVMADKYVTELKEALIELDAVPKHRTRMPVALEIGCGVGVYIKWLRALGYRYVGLEPDREVAEFTTARFRKRNTAIQPKTFEDFCTITKFDLVLACHVFEHMEDAPKQMRRVCNMMDRKGRLILIVPDDEDPVNPDHLWFFKPEQLKETLEHSGFRNVRYTLRRRVPHENFIYAVAEK